MNENDMARNLNLVDILRIMIEVKEMNYIELLSRAVSICEHAEVINMAKADRQIVSVTGELGLAKLYNESLDRVKMSATIRVAAHLGTSSDALGAMIGGHAPSERVVLEVLNRSYLNSENDGASQDKEYLGHEKYTGFVKLLEKGADKMKLMNSARGLGRLLVASNRVLPIHSIEFRSLEVSSYIKNGEYVRYFPAEQERIRQLVDQTIGGIEPRGWIRSCLKLLLSSSGCDIKDRYHDVFDWIEPHMLPHELLEVELISSQ